MNKFKLSALAVLAATAGMFGAAGSAMADQPLVERLSQLKLNIKMLDNRAAEAAWTAPDWAPTGRPATRC